MTSQEAIETSQQLFGAGSYALEKVNRYPRFIVEDVFMRTIGQGNSYEEAIEDAVRIQTAKKEITNG